MSGAKQQRIVALDSMVLVWGFRKKGAPEKITYAGYLFTELERDKAQIIIPSVVVAECITPICSEQERGNVVAEMGKRFILAPFDARDAIFAADLWRYGRPARKMNTPGARVCLRADVMIVATAANHGAQEFFTDDDDCLKMAARAGMIAKRLPTMGSTLFE